MKNKYYLLALVTIIALFPLISNAQNTQAPFNNPRFIDTTKIKLMPKGFATDYIVVGSDTMTYTEVPDVVIGGGAVIADKKFEKPKKPDLPNQVKYKGQTFDINRLRQYVRLVYPYAVTAKYTLQEIDDGVKVRQGDKKKQKEYKKAAEDQMGDRFTKELKNLSTTQGYILVKLINRETGRDCYSIVKDLKGGLTARFWQTAAFFYNNNLKKQYDPFGDDKTIEALVQEIEHDPRYTYPIWKLDESLLPKK